MREGGERGSLAKHCLSLTYYFPLAYYNFLVNLIKCIVDLGMSPESYILFDMA